MIIQRQHWINLAEECPINIDDITNIIFKFYRSNNITEDNAIALTIRILEAKKLVENARILIKSMIEPETGHNTYVNAHIDSYKWMNENFGRFDRLFMDNFENQVLNVISNNRTLVNPQKGDDLAYLKIKSFSKQLEIALWHLVYYPLRKATDKYYSNIEIEKEGTLKIPKRDANLFYYFVFINLFHASEMLGAWTRDDKKQTNITTESIPPEMPRNVILQEKSETLENQNLSRDPFKEFENEII